MAANILILTSELDPSVQPVIDILTSLGANPIKFPTETLPLNSSIEIIINNNKQTSIITLPTGDLIDIKDIHSFWYRHPGKPTPNNSLGPREFAFAREECMLALEGLWRTREYDSFWVSAPSAMRRCSYRIFQLTLAQRLGFVIPSTIVTNNPARVAEFFKKHDNNIIVKAIGAGVPVIENPQQNYYEVVFTHKVTSDDIALLSHSIRHSPCIFQNLVAKDIELRVTVVGEKVFCCAIHSQEHDDTDVRIDWRRVSPIEMPHNKYTLPEEINNKCITLIKELGLNYGAIDIIKTPSGEYVFLEINCDGQYGWIEYLTHMPIAEAMADLLYYHHSNQIRA